MKNTLNRKYLSQAIDGSLDRFGLDFVDLVFCHRPDPHTPLEETVWAMSDMITQGKALYWGTSEWAAAEIMAAWAIADKHHLHKPLFDQTQYNLLCRERVENEYARLYDEIGLGLTTWSPLALAACAMPIIAARQSALVSIEFEVRLKTGLAVIVFAPPVVMMPAAWP